MRFKKWMDETTLTPKAEVGPDAIAGDDKDEKEKVKKFKELIKRIQWKKKKDDGITG